MARFDELYTPEKLNGGKLQTGSEIGSAVELNEQIEPLTDDVLTRTGS